MKCALSEVKVLFLSATKLMIVSLSLSTVNIEKKSLSLSQVQNKDSSVARTCSHLVTSAVPAHLKDAASAPVRVNQMWTHLSKLRWQGTCHKERMPHCPC